ncbi:uncharacterized protein LOC130138230 [Syzygium oleosum]|uniref:uncharacterized protein LOC130138230 n=1 Tax=Syzygium oleosum TaxID=219896 RepID=UPI0024BA47B7|nr:uncharacterized protein LOC130138230 [Syzygium oleosum]
MAGDWSDLPSHLLELIAFRLPIADPIDFRETCPYWGSVAVQLLGSFQPRIGIPWLMITDQTRPDLCGFFMPQRQSFYEFPLPEVRAKRCLSSRGWIMTIGRDGDVEMFNPISRERHPAKLSGFKDWGGEKGPITNTRICTCVLSACPFSPAKFEIMVLCDANRRLGTWNYRNQAWTVVSPYRIYMDLIYHKGSFLAMDAGGMIRAFDVRQDGLNPDTDGRVVARRPPGLVDLEHFKKHYLVECRRSLLVVSQEWQQGSRFVTSRFRAFLLDLEANTWTKVDSLGNASLFLGLDSSFSVEVSDQHRGIEPDCIYFADDRMCKHA